MNWVGLLCGADCHNGQDWSKKISLQNTGSTDVYRLGGYPNPEAKIIHITKGYFRQKRRHTLTDYSLLINLVTDPDLNEKVLRTMMQVLRNFRGSVLNPPEKVLLTGREAIARRTAGLENVLVPRARTLKSLQPSVLASLEKSGGIAFPAIVRKTGTHSGKVSKLSKTASELNDLPDCGQPHTLTEYIDYRSHDGLFRKYRVFFFGKNPVFRHQLISDHWNVHMADRARFMMDRPEILAESQSLYKEGMANFSPIVQNALRAIYDRVGLDFCGIDFGVMPDERVVLFEANATMNFFPISDDPRLTEMKLCLERGEASFRSMVEVALQKSERRS
jgi:hypothetical protein